MSGIIMLVAKAHLNCKHETHYMSLPHTTCICLAFNAPDVDALSVTTSFKYSVKGELLNLSRLECALSLAG